MCSFLSVVYSYTERESHDTETSSEQTHNTAATTSDHHTQTADYRHAIDRVACDVAAFLTASCVGKVVLLHEIEDD